MKVSIAMATYNGANYLQDQLDSFVKQTRQPDELIVCDDESSDETLSILERFKESAPFRVDVFVNRKRLGFAQNFGQCLSKCSGDLVFMSDQDDVWFNRKIDTIARGAEQDRHAQVFMNDAVLTYEDLKPTGLTKLGQIRSARISKKHFVMGCCSAVRHNLLVQLLPIPPSFPTHDSWIVGFAEGLGRKKIIEEPLQYYRRHGLNMSQFMANRTHKISKYERLLNQIMKAVSDPGYTGLHQSNSNLDQFIIRAESWLAKTSDKILIDDLTTFIKKTKNSKRLIEARIELRAYGRLLRIFYGAKLLWSGAYKESRGVQSYLRDILF